MKMLPVASLYDEATDAEATESDDTARTDSGAARAVRRSHRESKRFGEKPSNKQILRFMARKNQTMCTVREAALFVSCYFQSKAFGACAHNTAITQNARISSPVQGNLSLDPHHLKYS